MSHESRKLCTLVGMDNIFERTVSVLRDFGGHPPETLRELCDEVFHHPVPLSVQENVRSIAASVGVKYVDRPVSNIN